MGWQRKKLLKDPMPAFGEENSRGNRAERKWCCGCLEWHPLDAFRPSETFNRQGGAGGYCREYRSAASRRWRERNSAAVEQYNAARRVGPRERDCVDCGATFAAGERGPASDRCSDCRVNASSSSDAWAGQRHSTWRPKARERRTREPA